jgi:Xaa-Pro aminopeptidase
MKTRLISLALSVLMAPSLSAERIAYPPEEFQERRTALCAELEPPGTVMLFAETSPPIGVRFRQDNDFYYVTGNEDKNAVVVIDAAECTAWLFLPPQTEREASRDGWNWLYQDGAGEHWGFDTIHPLHYLDEFLARRRISGSQRLYVRLSERDLIDQSRTDAALFYARRLANPWGGQPSEGAWRIGQLRSRYPHYELIDVTPALDELRMHKTAREIEARAIAITRPGRYEYELEAAATHEMIANGAEHPAYPAIVGGGANGNIWHYNDSAGELKAGDLVVMDYGASFGYQTMDITRTWPVSGEFDELQAKAYRAVLEAQKAIIAAMKPGVERSATREIAQEIFERHGFGEGHYPGGAGHFVGMAVHDVGDYSRPLEVGMVIAVEPIIEIPEHNLHIRIEDTVLITEDGAENLSASVPKELEEIEALVGSGN